MGEKNKKIKDCEKNYININSRSSKLDAKTFVILAFNKVGSFFQAHFNKSYTLHLTIYFDLSAYTYQII